VLNYVAEIATGISPFRKRNMRKRKTWDRPTVEYHIRIPKVVLSLLRDERVGADMEGRRLATIVASNTTFDLVFGPSQTTISFNNEELLVTDDQAPPGPLSHFFRVYSKAKPQPAGVLRDPQKALHATAVLTFSPSSSPDTNLDDAHLNVRTVVGFVEANMSSNSFPPFVEFVYRLLSPLDADTLTFLGAFQDISRGTSRGRQLEVVTTSAFEGGLIRLCHQARQVVLIQVDVISMEFSQRPSIFEAAFDIGAVLVSECGDPDPTELTELLTTNGKKFGNFRVTSFSRKTGVASKEFAGYDTALYFRSNQVNAFFSETIVVPLTVFMREMLRAQPIAMFPAYFSKVLVDSVQEYLPLGPEAVRRGRQAKPKSLVHFDVVVGGFTHQAPLPQNDAEHLESRFLWSFQEIVIKTQSDTLSSDRSEVIDTITCSIKNISLATKLSLAGFC